MKYYRAEAFAMTDDGHLRAIESDCPYFSSLEEAARFIEKRKQFEPWKTAFATDDHQIWISVYWQNDDDPPMFLGTGSSVRIK